MSKETTEKNLFTVQEAADFFNVSPATIRRWAYHSYLSGRKIGIRGDWRFTKEELEALAQPNSPETTPHTFSEAPKPELLPVPGVGLSILEAIVQSSDDAIISKSLDGTIRSWNTGAEHIFGYKAQEVIGKHITIIIPPERLDEETLILSKLRKGEKIDHFETQRLRKDGRIIDVSLTVSPIKDLNGKIVGASKVARDITEQKSHERVMREEQRRKDEFLAVLAHELRNPLAPISSATQILELNQDLSEESKWAVNVIRRQLIHMTRLIDDLLDISRITGNKLELRKEKLDLDDVLKAAIETSQPVIEEGRHELIVSSPKSKIFIEGDMIRLSQVFSNLLTNAAKYTAPGGTIWLNATEENGEAVVRIRDTGVGISEEMLPRVFEMFVQGPRSEHSNRGLGIGLTLVKRLLEMHGGSITAESEGSGAGSTFTARLPALVPGKETPATGRNVIASGDRKRILVVDDNEDALTTLALTLKLQGHETSVAHDGLEAIELARKFMPEVILLDIGMPAMNGYEVARLIRSEEGGDKKIKLIAVTGWGQATDKRKAEEAGFDYHLTKPLNPEVLTRILAQ